MLCFVFVFSSVFTVFEEKQVFQASFRLKKQFEKKLEAIGLIAALLSALDSTYNRIERNNAQAPKLRIPAIERNLLRSSALVRCETKDTFSHCFDVVSNTRILFQLDL